MGVQIIEPVLDYDFFTQTMKWSPDIWNLDNLDGNTLPRLSFE